MKDFMETSIDSYRSREKDACKRAVSAIMGGYYNAAAIALQEAAQYKACADELQFQLDCAEDGDD